MGILSWLTGSKSGKGASGATEMQPGRGSVEIVGESYYQKQLGKIVGGKTEDGVKHLCVALLIPEVDNPYDKNAVRVEIGGEKVGQLSSENAEQYRISFGNIVGQCPAKIVGGWDRGDGEEGHFGVKLKVVWPPKISNKVPS